MRRHATEDNFGSTISGYILMTLPASLQLPRLFKAGTLTLFFFLCLLNPAVAQTQKGPAGSIQKIPHAPEDSSLRIKVDVNLTVLFATVTNTVGIIDRTLTRDDFEIRENGKTQEIAFFSRESELPLRVALLVDTSLSTARDLKFEEDAAVRFFRAVLRPQDGAALFDFSYDVSQISSYTNDVEALSRAIRRLEPASGTSLFDAILLASETLRQKKQKKVIVIVSDGADTTSRVDYHAAHRAADQAQAIIYSIIIVPIKNDAGRSLGGEHALITLAEETGGKAFLPNSVGELDGIYKRISDELRSQYTLGYYSTVSAPSNELREISLTTRPPRLVVRTRRGYFSTATPP